MAKWEEKNYTEQKKNCLNNNEQEEIVIIKNIPRESKSKECKNTGWTRNCPMCNKLILHKTKYIRNGEEKLQRKCKKCADIAKKSTKVECTRNCPKCKKTLLYKKKWSRDDAEKRGLQCGSCAKIKNIKLTRNCPQCNIVINYKDGSKLNRATKENRVCNTCKKKLFIETMVEKSKECGNRSFFPNYNKTACEYFNWLNKFMGWDGQYATYKGEKNILNYFVDYYEPTQNIVIEWDEKYHRRKKQKKLDMQRQVEIKKFLGCRFYRYNDLTGGLEEV